MILIDQNVGSKELIPHIERIGVKAEKTSLPFGDAAFEGKGPDGPLSVGIERKTLHDMLACIEDARYAGHQRVGMKELYNVSVLLIEGQWRPHDNLGLLMEGFQNGTAWGFCKHTSQRVMYSKLYRYLISVAMSGVIVTYSRDLYHSAFNICEWYHWFQKAWHQHTSLKELHRPNIPTLNARPSTVRLWAYALDGIGAKHSEMAERMFRKPIALATADEADWLKIPGVGVQTAQNIVRDINGWKK